MSESERVRVFFFFFNFLIFFNKYGLGMDLPD